MTHRDELSALQARLEARERELDEARAEIELLRAAHAQKTRQIEQLRRELADLRGGHAPLEDELPTRGTFGLPVMAIGGTALIVAITLMASARDALPPTAMPTAEIAPAMVGVHFGRVVSGGTPEVVPVGETCSVTVEPVHTGPFDCRIEVRCGDRILYGATPETGFARCGGKTIVRDTGFSTRDGDPSLELDFTARRVTIEEQLGLGTQRVEIELPPLFD